MDCFYRGKRFIVYATQEIQESIAEIEKTNVKSYKKFLAQIQYIADTPSYFNDNVFKTLHDTKCNLFEYKWTQTDRYFAVLCGRNLCFFHKDVKKKRSFSTKEYNLICEKAKKLGL